MRADELMEDDDTLKMFYDEGNFPVSSGIRPIFSKPFWRTLNHHTRTPQDRMTILKSKRFIAGGNPVIIPGVYTVPNQWDDREGDPATSIKIITRQCKFAHNGADRPIEGMMGFGSVWWNKLWCEAMSAVYEPVRYSPNPQDVQWMNDHRDVITHNILDFERRKPFIVELTKRMHDAGIDILGNGGEFIILNQEAIWWERMYEEIGMKTPYQKVKESNEAACEAVQKIIHSFQVEYNKDMFASLLLNKFLISKRSIIFTNFYFKSDNLLAEFLGLLQHASDEHKVRIGVSVKGIDGNEDVHKRMLANAGYVEKDGLMFRAPSA